MTALPMVLMSDEEVAGYGRNPDAGFGALRTERGLLPLVAMDVDARVAGVIATIELAQTFVNTTGGAIEATYIFPLPDRAAVHRFQMKVADRVIEGVIEERGQAREQYDQAIAAGHRAAITEQERPGVFTLRVGNLMPGDAATVQLSLVGPLPVDDGEVTFRFPLVVAPRYIPGAALGGDQAGLGREADTDLVPDASRISPPVMLPGCPNPVRLGLRVALEDGVLRDVASSLHTVTVARRDAQVVEVQPGERLDRDFILRWRVDGDALRSQLVCADDKAGGGGTFALTIVPPSTTAVAAKPRDVVFVIDRSGSMGGWKMVAARRAAARMIDTLTSRDRFCAIAFDGVVERLPEAGLVDATDRNRFRAVEALAKVDARGGTEIAEPLICAVAMLGGGTADRERVVMLVTDGQVGNEDDVLRQLAPSLRDIKMFTLGIDQAVNAAFLRRLAAAGGGLCELVESEDRLDAVMSKVHRRIGTPIATELALRPTRLEVDRATLAPAKLPDVYAGAPVVIFGRYRGSAPASAAIEVEGTSLGDPLKMTVGLRGAVQTSSWLAASWARAHIRDLEDRYAAGKAEVEAQIVRVSTQFRVLSRFTAFLAVDHAAKVNEGGRLHQVVQPVESPAGWRGSPGAPPPPPRTVVYVPSGGATPKCAFGPPDPTARTVEQIMLEAQMIREGSPAMPPSAAPQGFARMDPMAAAPPSPQQPPPAPASPSPAAAGGVRRARKVTPPGLASGGGLPYGGPPGMPPAMPEASEHELSATVTTCYLRELLVLAVALDTQAKSGELPAIRSLRQRLTQWVEDLRSSGGSSELAAKVEALIERLSDALAIPDGFATSSSPGRLAVALVAEELAKLGAGGTPPPEKKKSRLAFWK